MIITLPYPAAEKRIAQPASNAISRSEPASSRNALSGNDSRSANWQAQQQRGAQSRQLAARHQQPRQALPDVLNTVNSVIVKGANMKKNLVCGMVLFMMSAAAMAQQSFSTPAQATDALAHAISEQNETAMNNLLGENWRDFLPPEGVDPEAVDRFLRDWKVRHNTVIDGNTAHLVVGNNDWQLPIPVCQNRCRMAIRYQGGRRGDPDPRDRA
ncbi:periplasmic protein [Enterobacter cloacae]|uniref:Periplasmic protein n=1 Tax=Enterobacter cloacae TaxID=550 RepID=A0A377M6L6_ENTCL|nr:periplasmic protein [Enterobacter cloacae]